MESSYEEGQDAIGARMQEAEKNTHKEHREPLYGQGSIQHTDHLQENMIESSAAMEKEDERRQRLWSPDTSSSDQSPSEAAEVAYWSLFDLQRNMAHLMRRISHKVGRMFS